MKNPNSQNFISSIEPAGYRAGLALYSAGAFILPCLLALVFDPKIYAALGEKASLWRDQQPIYPRGHIVLILSVPIGLFIFFAPHFSRLSSRWGFSKSHGFAIFEFAIFFALCAIAFLCFGLNAVLAIEFMSFGFIICATDYLRGFSLGLDFASNDHIAREARIEKLRLVHRKWFAGISALVTVAVAVCITAALKLYDIWRLDFGIAAAELMIRTFMILILYAAAGLVLGPFAHLLNILGIIEDHFEKIETQLVVQSQIPRHQSRRPYRRKATNA